MSRNAEYEQRKKDGGFKKVTVWVPADRESDIKHAINELCENENLTINVLRDLVTGRLVSMNRN
ncbi:hypothetical protein [Photobacterium halotolerans]|uniref:Uncharacterized protein n=1 Tax=Photobacterium halotolerans TaxID=265726 RepID=A0A7X4W829_9GAMM|nr:hypothetical protein [Photobacterium halotolerans]NAW63909.1 hypothetical protein [Photobacterium halotolerans]